MFKCYRCGHKQREPGTCEICGSVTAFVPDNFTAISDMKQLASENDGIWRYASMLPDFPTKVTLGEGNTPLIRANRLSSLLGVDLYIKNESVNPTGSYLDRGSAVAISYAASYGKKEIHCESRGNVGASLAAYAVRAGLGCSLYYSEIKSLGKLYQTLAYGAKLVKGQLPEVLPPSAHVSGEMDSYFLTGLKTLSYEIFEKKPNFFDYIFISVGEGGGISMLFAGFQDTEELFKARVPALVGVYLSAQNSIVDDLSTSGIHGTLADFSISVTGGFKIKVEDSEIVEAMRVLARSEGLFAEPAAAVALAGLIKAVDWGLVGKNSRVLYILTGSGLKDPVAIGTLIGVKARQEEEEGAPGINDTKKAILNILYVEPAYGYRIWKKLKEMGIEKTLPDVYIALKDLLNDGLIKATTTARGGRFSKIYELTTKGRKYVELLLSY
ncbi:MAG: pyridoxal-phosphate dependent enzyme [Nitrososphaeria archaeon]